MTINRSSVSTQSVQLYNFLGQLKTSTHFCFNLSPGLSYQGISLTKKNKLKLIFKIKQKQDIYIQVYPCRYLMDEFISKTSRYLSRFTLSKEPDKEI